MPTFRISVTNQTFRSSNQHDLPTLEAARRHGIRAALAIGVDEVTDGNPYFGAEVLVEDEEKTLHRFVVSIGASSLQ